MNGFDISIQVRESGRFVGSWCRLKAIFAHVFCHEGYREILNTLSWAAYQQAATAAANGNAKLTRCWLERAERLANEANQ